MNAFYCNCMVEKFYCKNAEYYRYQEILKTDGVLLSYDVNDYIYSKVKIHLTLYGFSQYRSYMDFNLKLDRYWLGLLINFDKLSS